MSWSLSVTAAAQHEARELLEDRRDAQAEQVGGYSEAVRAQQDAAFAAADLLVSKAEFHGRHVNCSLSGHVAQSETEADNVSIYVSGAAG